MRRSMSLMMGSETPPRVPPTNGVLKVALSFVVVVAEPGTAFATQLVAVTQVASVSPSQTWLAAKADEVIAQNEAQVTRDARVREGKMEDWGRSWAFIGVFGVVGLA